MFSTFVFSLGILILYTFRLKTSQFLECHMLAELLFGSLLSLSIYSRFFSFPNLKKNPHCHIFFSHSVRGIESVMLSHTKDYLISQTTKSMSYLLIFLPCPIQLVTRIMRESWSVPPSSSGTVSVLSPKLSRSGYSCLGASNA